MIYLLYTGTATEKNDMRMTRTVSTMAARRSPGAALKKAESLVMPRCIRAGREIIAKHFGFFLYHALPQTYSREKR